MIHIQEVIQWESQNIKPWWLIIRISRTFPLFSLSSVQKMFMLCDNFHTVVMNSEPEIGCIPFSSIYEIGVTSDSFSGSNTPDRSDCRPLELQTGDLCFSSSTSLGLWMQWPSLGKGCSITSFHQKGNQKLQIKEEGKIQWPNENRRKAQAMI